MTGYTVNTGSSRKFSEGWENSMGKKTKKKATKKKVVKKKAAKKKK
jgi:hypothetical protein